MSSNDNTVSMETAGSDAIENMRRILGGVEFEDDDVSAVQVEFVMSQQDSDADADSDDTTETDTADEPSEDVSSNGSTNTDRQRHCPKAETYKHAVLEMLVLAEREFEGISYFPPTVLANEFGDQYDLDRKQIANALIASFQSDRMCDRMRHGVVAYPVSDPFDCDVDNQEYAYSILDAGRDCLGRRGPYPGGPADEPPEE
jgi:hypothetical protein